MTISSSDFLNWKDDNVTKAVLSAINERIDEAVGSLTGTPRNDLDAVNWTRGYIEAFKDILNIKLEDVENA